MATRYSIPWIAETLQRLAERLDKNKCAADVRAVDDGYAIDVRTFSSDYCSFHMEVTPQLFDIDVAGRFSIGDVEHSWADFERVAISIAFGRVKVWQKRGLVFKQPILEVEIPGESSFCITGSFALRSMDELPVYSSYVIKGSVD